MAEATDEPTGEESSEPAGALFERVYARLKAMAAARLAGSRSPTLDTTALVHDLYLRIGTDDALRFGHEAQFFAYAARAMRHLLADRVRHSQREKAGGDWQRVTLTLGGEGQVAVDGIDKAIALETALAKLEALDARAARVVELRYFAGLSLEHTAEVLGLARRTVDRDWRFARAFLKSALD